MNDKLKEYIAYFVSVFRPAKPENPLDGLKSAETIRKEKLASFKKRLIVMVIVLPLIFFFLIVVIKSYFVYTQQRDKTVATKQIEKPEMKLEFNSFTRWQDIKDEEDKRLSNEVESLKEKVSEVSVKIDKSAQDVSETMSQMKTSLENTLAENQKIIKEALIEASETTENKIKNITNELNSKVDNVKQNVATKLDDLKIKAKEGVTVKLPPLPPLEGLNNDKEKKQFEKQSKTKSLNLEKLDRKIDLEVVEEEIYEEEDLEVASYDVSTLKNYEEVEEKKEEIPSFTIMPGFMKAVIVGGADVPTLEQAASQPKPIWLTVNSEQLIANGKKTNFKDCLIEAVSTGDIGTKRARFALKTLSCSMTDLEGKNYKVVTPLKGNVYGEDGKIGAKGRLVSREGEIIEKGVPLATLEGIIQTLSNANNYIYPSGTNGGADNQNPLMNFTSGGANTGAKILSKFSEYYLKILESLNPYIEIKPKRVVTIAISEPAEVTPVEYNPFDVNYFAERDIYEEDLDEEDY